jgi:tetratricopeptide (TPR) repeat protein
VRLMGRDRRGWVFVGAAAVLAGASAVLARLWVPGVVAGGVGAAIAVVTGVWIARGTSALQARDTQRRFWFGEVLRDRDGRLPLVRDLDDPIALGVHPAPALDTAGRDRCPPFVMRDFSAGLCLVLQRDRFVLLVGESTAGKSRAAFELIRAELAGSRVVQPFRRDAVQASAELAAATPGSVLWLDDLERFLGSAGLTSAAVRMVLDATGKARYIVATMRSEEYARFSGRTAFGLEGPTRDALRQGWDVLRIATRVEVARMWSPEEITHARQLGHDPRLAEAVRHTNHYGVAEYIAAAPQLLAEWRDAWAPGTHPRAAALVIAAIDARRAGVHRPLPLPTLLQLHQPYLERRGGERLRPEGVEEALAWATTPLYATSSLLAPMDDGFVAFDYLIDAVDRDRVPATSLDALIAFATPGEALDIGQLAWSWSLIAQAEAALIRAEAGGFFEATERRCSLIGEDRGGGTAALNFAKDAAEWQVAAFGSDHPDTLAAFSLVAWQTGLGGDATPARILFEDLTEHCSGAFGVNHELTLKMRRGVAAMTGHQGEYVAAAQRYQDLSSECSRILGEDHDMTLSCRDQAAMWLCEAGDPVRAAELFKDIIADMEERFQSRGDEIFHARSQRAECLVTAGEYEQALGEFERLIHEAAKTYGRLNNGSLYIRMQHAWCVGEAGSPEIAVNLLQRLLADVEALEDPELVMRLFVRRALAWWIGEAGDPSQAVQRLRALIEEASVRRSDDDARVSVLRYMLTHWNAIDGPPGEAVAILQHNITQMRQHIGLAHAVTRASLRELTRRQ